MTLFSDDSSGKFRPGDRVRQLADQLQQETQVQVRATARILGAAAKIAENHDRLIDEVVEVVERDLDKQFQHPSVQNQSVQNQLAIAPQTYTVQCLKQQFRTLAEAKTHFGLTANGWDKLVAKLNQSNHPTKNSIATKPQQSPQFSDTLERITTIEQTLQTMQKDIANVLTIVTELLVIVRRDREERDDSARS